MMVFVGVCAFQSPIATDEGRARAAVQARVLEIGYL